MKLQTGRCHMQKVESVLSALTIMITGAFTALPAPLT